MIDPPSMTNQDLTRNIFLKIQHVYGQKIKCTWLIDPPEWQTRISPRIFYGKDSTCVWSKDDWPPIDPCLVWFKMCTIDPSHQEFFLKIQHVYGQKMIDPPRMTNQDLT